MGKLQGKNVLFVGQRKIQRQRGAQKLQRSRTMKSVHESILDDIVYPSDIFGKRIRQKVDGSKHLKVFLDARDKDRVESKLDAFRTAYNKLTGREVQFGFMSNTQM